MMKKKVLLAMALTLILMVFAGCGADMQDSEYLGTWKATTAEYSGMTVKVEDIYGEMSFTFDKNGKVTIVTEEDEATAPWEETEDGVVIRSGDEDITMKKVKDNVLVCNYNDVNMTFERVEGE